MAALFKIPGSKRPPDNPEDFKASLVEHLDELRTRIIRVVWMLVIAWIFSWYFVQTWMYETINGMIKANVLPILNAKHIEYREPFRTATEAFMLKLKLSFLIGLIICVPFIVLQAWGYVAPALKPNERRPFRILAPLSVFLFALGAGFAWWVTPNALKWFTSYIEEFPGTSLYQEPGLMVLFVGKMLLAFGIAFQLPLVVYGLGAIGLLKTASLMKSWRHWTLSIFVISAVLTPSNDAFTMLMMAIPLCVLFMISVYAVKLTQRKKKKPDESSIDA